MWLKKQTNQTNKCEKVEALITDDKLEFGFRWHSLKQYLPRCLKGQGSGALSDAWNAAQGENVHKYQAIFTTAPRYVGCSWPKYLTECHIQSLQRGYVKNWWKKKILLIIRVVSLFYEICSDLPLEDWYILVKKEYSPHHLSSIIILWNMFWFTFWRHIFWWKKKILLIIWVVSLFYEICSDLPFEDWYILVKKEDSPHHLSSIIILWNMFWFTFWRLIYFGEKRRFSSSSE